MKNSGLRTERSATAIAETPLNGSDSNQEFDEHGWTVVRCQTCGEQLVPIAVKGQPMIYPTMCRHQHPTGITMRSDDEGVPWTCWCLDQPRCCETEGGCCVGCERRRDDRMAEYDGCEDDD